MTTFKLWQINFTNHEVARINSDDPEMKVRYYRYLDTTMGGKVEDVNEAWEAGDYQHVANIKTELRGLEEVFEIGNIGPEERITRFLPMHSVSVGDVVEDQSGKRFAVQSYGFGEM